MVDSLSQAQARRIALAAQGFCDPVHARPTMRTFERTLARTGVLQVDSVNVLQRAHHMPLYSRMGPHEMGLLARANTHSASSPRRVVEYWAHVQAFMPVALWPLMRHRMEHYRSQRGKWWQRDDDGLEREVLAAVRDRGPSTARELEAELGSAQRTKEHWGWNWSETRKELDFLYSSGQLAINGRTSSFEVQYDVPERVLPAAVLAQPTPDPATAARELVRRAAISHGVASAQCLADYYRMKVNASTGVGPAGTAIAQLVEAGELVPVQVEGWSRPAYLHRDAKMPRKVAARTLLSPFDPVVWERARTEALFDFFYRIEIYVPREKRVHGYYVLPFLLGDQLVARVDLKADRQGRRLLVEGAFAEPGAPADTAEELAVELERLAGWLELDHIVVGDRGDLAPALRGAVGAPGLARG